MSEMSREARRANRAKAYRLANAMPGKVDASDFTPAEDLKADVATGMRPVSRRAYKAGGKVEGEKPKANAGKMQRTKRADGGEIYDPNKNAPFTVHDRNGARKAGPMSTIQGARRARDKHDNAYGSYFHHIKDSTGQRRASGGKIVADSIANTNQKSANEERDGEKHVGGLKRGGRAFEGSAKDMREDKKLAAKHNMSMKEWEASAADKKHDAPRAKRSTGGDVALGLLSPVGGLINALSGGKGKKSGGSVSDGTLQGTRPTGGRMARKDGGRTKGSTAINIIIGRPGGSGPSDAPGPLPSLGGPGAIPVPVGPPGLGAMGAQIPSGPPPGMPPMAPGAGAPPPMPMPRKSGGRTTMTDGAGSGLGRLEKTAIAKRDR